MYQDQISEHKKKLLEYLEKECEQQHSTNAEITNRAGVTATILAGITFLALDNNKLGDKILYSSNCFTLSSSMVLSVLFLLSFIVLAVVLLYKRDFIEFAYHLELTKVYGDSEQQPREDCTLYYSLRKYYIWKENKKILEFKACLFNISLLLEMIAAIIYICSINI